MRKCIDNFKKSVKILMEAMIHFMYHSVYGGENNGLYYY